MFLKRNNLHICTFNIISKNMNVQINLLFSLISISCLTSFVCWVIRRDLFIICFCDFSLNYKTFAISNFCTTGIRYLEHLLFQTFAIWLVPPRFEIMSTWSVVRSIHLCNHFFPDSQFFESTRIN